MNLQKERNTLGKYEHAGKKGVKFLKIVLDLSFRLCYSMSYLSDERFSFCALFSENRAGEISPSPYREAMPAPLRERVNKIGGAERMAAGARVKITLRCEECKQRNYNTVKNKKNTSDRLERSKYCPFCRKHTKHVETK